MAGLRIGLIIASIGIVSSTVAPARPLTIERILAKPSLNGDTAQGVRVSPDGRFVGYLRAASDDPTASVLWLRPMAGGAARALIDTRALGTAAGGLTEEQMKLLERRHQSSAAALDYWWDAQGRQILASYDGDLFLIAVASGQVRRLTTTEASELDPQLSPDGRFVSFVRDRNLVVRAIADGSERAMGSDVSDTVSYGTAEFIAQEEIQRFTGQWWSPDAKRLAYTRVDEGPVSVVPRIAVGKDRIEVVRDRFPLAGTTNANVRLFVRAVDGGAPVAVDLGTDLDIYLFACTWSTDGRTLYVERQSRDQKRLDLLAVDPVTGASHVLVSETNSRWVTLERDFRPLADGTFLWGSARTGWRHLYLYRGDGTLIRAVTSGQWRLANPGAAASPEFRPIVGVDERHGDVYIVASIDTPIEQQLYRVSYRTPAPPVALTHGHGWWEATMPADTKGAFIGTYTDPQTPPSTGIYDQTGARRAWIAENRLDQTHPIFPYLDQRPTYSFGTIAAADGTPLHYWLAKPAGFDPQRRYPVIINIYGGPGVQTVRRVWRGVTSSLTPPDQLYTQNGYLVFGLDNRGMSNRDEAFEHANSGTLGVVAGIDQIAGIAFLKTLPFVDDDRIGMQGWSFGGYTTVRVMTTQGHGLRAGAAGGVPSDFTLYDTHYTERFLGTPQANPQGYAASNLKPRLKDLTGALMVATGLSDDNVLLPNFTTLLDGLQQSGKLFETLVYPGQSHQLRGAATLSHLWRSYLDFFARSMAPRTEPKP